MQVIKQGWWENFGWRIFVWGRSEWAKAGIRFISILLSEIILNGDDFLNTEHGGGDKNRQHVYKKEGDLKRMVERLKNNKGNNTLTLADACIVHNTPTPVCLSVRRAGCKVITLAVWPKRLWGAQIYQDMWKGMGLSNDLSIGGVFRDTLVLLRGKAPLLEQLHHPMMVTTTTTKCASKAAIVILPTNIMIIMLHFVIDINVLILQLERLRERQVHNIL